MDCILGACARGISRLIKRPPSSRGVRKTSKFLPPCCGHRKKAPYTLLRLFSPFKLGLYPPAQREAAGIKQLDINEREGAKRGAVRERRTHILPWPPNHHTHARTHARALSNLEGAFRVAPTRGPSLPRPPSPLGPLQPFFPCTKRD